jgi:hypothetical protein
MTVPTESCDSLLKNRLWTAGIFAVAAIGFFAWRMSFDIIWDDTPSLAAIVYDADECPAGAQLKLGEPGAVTYGFRASFLSVGASGYRPLSSLLRHAGNSFFRPGGLPRWIWIAFVSLVVGLLATCCFHVALRFTRSEAWSVFAAILMLGSPAYACAAAVVIAGIQTIVLLLLCASLLLYWKATDATASRRTQRAAMAGLCLVLLFGPWFREFIGLSSVLVGLSELQRHRRLTRLAAFSGVALLHAVFPTFLVWAFLDSNLPLLPITRLGSLSAAIGGSGNQIRWNAFAFLLVQMPSLVYVAALAGVIARIVMQGWKPAFLDSDFAFLGLWFLFSFLPFFKVFTEHVHLMYALLPGSILAAVLLRDLQLAMGTRMPRLRYVVPLLTVYVVCDQCTSFMAMHVTTTRIIEGYKAVAAQIAERTRPGDVVVANFLGSEEIRFHGKGRNTMYFTIAAGVPHPSRVVDDPAELQELLDTVRPESDVYFLAAEFEYPSDKAFYHPHKFVRFNSIETESIGLLHETQARYLYLDPIELLVPRRFIPFPASPDLMNDFYLGPSRDGRRFWREVYAKYYLYRVTGRKVDPWLPTHEIRMVESGYKGYNILECNGRFFAIHQSEGAFDVGRACRGEYGNCGYASSIDRLRDWIVARALVPSDTPVLVESNHRGYNILQLSGHFYGIRQDDGAFDLDRYRRGRYRDGVDGKDLRDVKSRIQAIFTTAGGEPTRS